MSIVPPISGVSTPPQPLTAVSLFAGVGGIDLALNRAGVHVNAAVEIDDAARGVIADRLPKTALFTDVTKVTADELRATGFVPERGILTAGWPCQGNSVAGGRAGLADPRSGLWRHVVRLLAELRPRWFLGENVPGLLSVTDGEDFGLVLEQLAELGYGFAYRVLDAQFFGVPQRRRRVFIVGCLGDARGPVEVLLEPEGSDRNPPAGCQAGQGVAATLTRGSSRAVVSTPGRRQEDDINLVVANCLTAREGKGPDSDATTTLIVANALTSSGVGTCGADDNQAQANHLIVQPVALRGRADGAELEVGSPGDVAHALRTAGGGSSHGMIAVGVLGDNTHTLTSEGADASEDGTGRGTPVVAFAWQAGGNNDASGTINEEMSPTLPKSQTMAVQTATAVRRLTPTECERLQGFPDDWTATSNGKDQADSARYRQMGNAVAVPCVEWIARRIVVVAK